MARGSRAGQGILLALPLLAFLCVAVAWPLATLIRISFAADHGRAVATVLAAPRTHAALANSLLLSALAALGSLLVAATPAWVLARDTFPGRSVLRSLLLLPLTFSGVMVGFLAIVVLGRAGLVPAVARLVTGVPLGAGAAYTIGGIFLAYLYFEVPRATLALEAAIRRVPPDQDRAARSLGAGPIARFVRVFLPAVTPAVRSTLALTFSASMGSFGVVLILARKFTVVPLEVYTALTGFGDDAAAGTLCLLLAAATIAIDRVVSGRRP